MIFRRLLTLSLLSLLVTESASAIILALDGEVNISIPNTFNGVYLDFTDANDANAYTLSTSSEPSSWDINPFFGGAAVATSDTFLPVLSSTTTNSPMLNLAPGTQVGPTSDFPSGYSGSSTHMGAEAQQFQNGSTGYIGFVLNPETDNYYGWMKLTLNDDGNSGVIHEWAWETSGGAIAVGAVPEPANFALLFGLVAACRICRRRHTIAH